MIHLTINGKPVEVLEGSTIMEAAEASGIRVPSLCHMKDVHQYGSCRIWWKWKGSRTCRRPAW